MKKKVFQFIAMTIGCFLSSLGVYCFAVSSNVPVTGVAGITSILYRLYGLPMGLYNAIINIPIIIVCYKTLGKKFFVRSAYCIFMYAFFTDYILVPYFPTYSGDRLLASLCCAVVMSFGDSIIYLCNSSTGGFDFISVTAKIKLPHIPLGDINLFTAIFIICLNGFIFTDVDSMIYGFILNFLSSRVVNTILSSVNSSKLLLIVTSDGKKTCETIHDIVKRGSTILPGFGGYKQENKDVVMCACSAKQFSKFEKEIKQIDEQAFVVMLETDEINGNGFKRVVFGLDGES